MKKLTIKPHTIAAIYMRLSREDESEGESGSIQNQREFLRSYAESNGIKIYKEFSDDGWSGTNFERPGFKAMISCIESGEINCVITKDLSRLGRNYLEVGYYTETYFPDKHIRYIAVNDHVDTNDGESDIAPFLNIFNEFHAKQTSKKVRAIFKTQFENGGCHWSIVPYGYKKDPTRKNRIVVDEKEAEVVRMIFQWCIDGYGAYAIMGKLYRMQIENPGYKAYLDTGRYSEIYENAPESRRYEWDLALVKRLLSNEVYLGHTIHYKKRKITYKSKKISNLPEEQWMRVENTHEPIVSQEIFDLAQSKIQSRKRISGDGTIQLFAGVAKCADCGRTLRYSSQIQSGKRYKYLSCSSNCNHAVKRCTRHQIRYEELQEIVLSDLQSLFGEANFDKKALINKISSVTEQIRTKERRQEILDYESLTKRKKELDTIFSRLYEDWAMGKVSENNFNMMSSKVQTEQEEINEKLSKISLEDVSGKDSDADMFVKLIDKFAYPTELTRELINAFIEKIVVHEPQKIPGEKKRKHTVEIYYRFIGQNNFYAK